MLINPTLIKLISFGLIGFINTGVDWVIFWLLGVTLAIPAELAWLAKGGSYSIAIIVSYILNSTITFRREASELRNTGTSHKQIFIRFFLIAILCMVINSTVYALTQSEHYMDLTALIIATLASFLLGFYLNYGWTYR
jgi:putative flippase GtrA